MKQKLRGMFIDPQSGDYSASRICLTVLVLDIQVLITMDYLGYPFGAWGHLAVIIGSVCGVYGLNTGLRVWRNKVVGHHDKEVET
jgi:hypothetical protein